LHNAASNPVSIFQFLFSIFQFPSFRRFCGNSRGFCGKDVMLTRTPCTKYYQTRLWIISAPFPAPIARARNRAIGPAFPVQKQRILACAGMRGCPGEPREERRLSQGQRQSGALKPREYPDREQAWCERPARCRGVSRPRQKPAGRACPERREGMPAPEFSKPFPFPAGLKPSPRVCYSFSFKGGQYNGTA